MFMQQARVLLPARLTCQFQPVAVGLVLVLAAGLVAPPPAVRADPSGPWWTDDNGAITKVAPCAIFYCGILLLQKESRGPGVRPFDWTPEGVAWKMNAGCRHPGIECSEGDAI
jgi:hypothetical protein